MFLRGLVRLNIPLVNFQELQGDLEDVFLQVTQGIVN